jgi:hypothetical protein
MRDFSLTHTQSRLHVVVDAVERAFRLLDATMKSDQTLDPALVSQVHRAIKHPWDEGIDPKALPLVYARWRCHDCPGGWGIHLSIQEGTLLISYDQGYYFRPSIPLVQAVLGDLDRETALISPDVELPLFQQLFRQATEVKICDIKLLPASALRPLPRAKPSHMGNAEARAFCP